MMGKTVRVTALIVAVLLGATLFLFALTAALGMAVLGVVALFAAYAVAPDDTKTLIARTGGMFDRWINAVVDVIRQSGELVRELFQGRNRTNVRDGKEESCAANNVQTASQNTQRPQD